MKKYIVETYYYTCTFKTVHSLNDLNDKELAEIDARTDGDVEVLDVKLNNRKTKKIGDKKRFKDIINKTENPISKNISEKIVENKKLQNKDPNLSLKVKTIPDSKCLIEEKDIFKSSDRRPQGILTHRRI